MSQVQLQFRLNGKDYSIQADPTQRMVDLLRENLHLTGTKVGCGVGECGACTVVVQCGFCTPGFLMSAYALLLHNPHPTREEIKVAVSGNLCRCTGYVPILNAIQAAGLRLAEEGE